MRKIFLLLAFACAARFLYADTPPPRQAALFALSAPGWHLPEGLDASIGASFQALLTSRGGFDVTMLPYQLSEAEAERLLEALITEGASEGEGGEARLQGSETAEILRSLPAGAVWVIPEITAHSVGLSRSGRYDSQLETQITFVDGKRLVILGQVTLDTLGVASSPQGAIRDAVDQIPVQLSFELQAVPGLKVGPAPFHLAGGIAYLPVGRKEGVKAGDEYAIVSRTQLSSGKQLTREHGLLLVTGVRDSYSFASVIYAEPGARIGEELKKIPRLGFESTAYLHVVANGGTGTGTPVSPIVYAVGTYEALTRGLYNFRPLIGVETIIASASSVTRGTPLNLYLGGELNWRMGRFVLQPLVAGGIGGTVPLQPGTSSEISTAGGFVQITLAYLVGNSVRIGLEGGLAQWFPLTSGAGYGGYYGGIGIGVSF